MSFRRIFLLPALFALVPLMSGCASAPAVIEEPPQVDTPPVSLEGSGDAADNLPALTLPPLKRPVSISLRGAGLIESCEKIALETGIGIAVDKSVNPAGISVYIELRHAPAEVALDWLTRIAKAYYVVDDNDTVLITRDLSRRDGKTVSRSYSVGTLTVIEKPILGRFDNTREKKNLLEILNAILRHVTEKSPESNLILDETGSSLNAELPPRGHELLAEALEELKSPQKYEPPPERDNPLEIIIKADIPEQDISFLLAELSERADSIIGCDVSKIPPQNRTVSLSLGETTLGEALKSISEQAGLGEAVVENRNRIWILAKDEDRFLLDTTGRTPAERATVRAYYIRDLVDQYGFELISKKIMSEITPNAWGKSLPYFLYIFRSGKLIMVHSEEHQKRVADIIGQIYNIGRPRRERGGR